VLVLDELGGEPLSEQGVIEEVVFARITAGRPTIITTGLDKEQLGMRYRAGFVRRILLDKSIATSVPMLKTREEQNEGADVLRPA
jgi:DNA replication protein DnaC